jgi:hypothetical protein
MKLYSCFSLVMFSCAVITLSPLPARSELIVNVAPVKTAGRKVDVKLELHNTFPGKVESARATVFLMDDQGKVAGQATHWVIGGTEDRPPLAGNAKSSFHFVIPLEKTTATNLQTRVVFNRLILEGGKLADVTKEVTLAGAVSKQ